MLSKLFRMHSRPSIWGALLAIAALCGLYAPPSFATAMYLGRATAELTITDIAGGTGLQCTACTSAFGDVFPTGNSSGSSTGSVTITGDPANLGSGDSMSLIAEALGSASPIGSVEGFFVAIGDIGFSNTNTAGASITVTLRLVWKLEAEASVASTANEDAVADAQIIVVTGSSVDPIVDTSIVSDVLGFLGPDGPQSASDDFTLSLVIAPGADDFINITLITGGFADALAAPEPGILPLFALVLAGLGFFARRRKTS